MKVVVLGAGVIGVSTAWYLSRAGHEVTVIERQAAPGLETSYANGGQISVSHAEPWASPRALLNIMRWLGREDAPLLFRLRADWKQWRWGLQFLAECLSLNRHHNIVALVRLALYSRGLLQALRSETGIQYDHSERGILHFYTDQAQFDATLETTKLMAELGCERVLKTPSEIVAIEPALRPVLPKLVGGDYTSSDESGDAYLFTRNLAQLCQAAGVTFCFDTTIERLERNADHIDSICFKRDGTTQNLSADAYVVAMGSYSGLYTEPLGVDLSIYPVKGYSVTIPIVDSDAAPRVSLSDDSYRIVFSRLGERLRVGGTAELNGYDTSINSTRCDALVRRSAELFPAAGDYQASQRWAGLRPATPSNLPYVCATRYRNLYLNTGHGTLGWTLACGSAQLLTDIVTRRDPAIDSSPYTLRRH